MSKPSPRWALFERYDIPDAMGRGTYLTRWRIVQTPWFGIYVHRINVYDGDRHLHDHPWSFVSVVLRGGYVEARQIDPTSKSPFLRFAKRGFLSFAFRRAETLHRITALLRRPTWTLVLVGRRRREWGFQTSDGWKDWRTYYRMHGYDTGD